MKYILYGLFSLILLSNCQNKPHNQIIKVVNYDELYNIVNTADDILYVVNFWATWCVPCVQEIPDFMHVNSQYLTNKNFKMILVSLDKASDLDTRVKPFIEKKQITTDVYLLDDNKRMNMWIPETDKTWSGAIPATVLYKNGKKISFTEGSLTANELKNLIKKHL